MMGSLISGEKGKIHSSVFAVLEKVGVGCKGIASRVFQYEKAFFIQDICAEYEIGKLIQTRVIKGRICKNNVKGLYRFLEVPESIGPDHTHLIHFQASASLLYKFEVHGCHFNG